MGMHHGYRRHWLLAMTGIAAGLCCSSHQSTAPASPTPPSAAHCSAPRTPLDLPQPLLTVGSGTPQSCSEAALRQAVDSLCRGGLGGGIAFNSGSQPCTIVVTQPLVIDAPHAPTLVIDGGGTITLSGGSRVALVRCGYYAALVLQRIVLIDAQTDSSGAAVYCPWFGTLDLINVDFRNNQCTTRGPEFGGGAVFAGGLHRFTVSNCAFHGNRASNGGAILSRGANLQIFSCSFDSNDAHGDGGGKDAGATGQGGLGGAVYVDGMEYTDSARALEIHCSRFAGNLSHCHGSAVFSYFYPQYNQQHSVIVNCEFDGNADSGTSTSMATLYHEGGKLALSGCTFAGNHTNVHAGRALRRPAAQRSCGQRRADADNGNRLGKPRAGPLRNLSRPRPTRHAPRRHLRRRGV